MSHLLHSLLPNPRRKLETVSPDTSVAQCILLMKTQDIGALVVMDAGNLLGIVSERDIIRSACQPGVDLETVKAADILYKAVPVLSEHDSVEKAMQVIIETKRRHFLIRENNQYTAIVSIGDLLFYLLDDDLRTIQHLEKYIAGAS